MIVGLLGSASADSLSRRGLLVVAEQVRAAGMAFDLVDLRDEFRELHDIDVYDEPPPASQTARLRERIARARGVVLATPVYHGGYSGLLKNALDHLTGDAFARRPVGTLAAGGGPRSASVACDQLRSVIRAMSGWSTPTHVGLSGGDFTDLGATAGLRERVADMVAEMREFDAMRAALDGLMRHAA